MVFELGEAGSEFKPHRVGLMVEYLVAAKLLELGWENVAIVKDAPYDLVACYQDKVVKIGVTGKGKGDWSFNAKSFLNIEFDEEKREQRIIKEREKVLKTLETDVFILVDRDEKDIFHSRFYIIPTERLANIIYDKYTTYQDATEKGNIFVKKRPKKWNATHQSIKEEDIKEFENGWEFLKP
jgi:hypothetical protein